MRAALVPHVNPARTFGQTLQAARAGDGAALAELTERFYPTVQRLVHARLGRDLRSTRPWLAARFSTGDVVQDVFHGVLRDLDAFGGDSERAFVGYLSMVVRNRIIDAVRFHESERRDGRRGGRAQDPLDAPATLADPAAEVASREQHERVRVALAALTPRDQLLLRGRVEELATFAELAEQLGYEDESGARRAFYAAQARLALALGGE
ncbi:MAG: sigma-70 family RNA polymerase sigma factor [bacterium]|nr:sigma-70 family RNA polymerase sigma factor [bacterium]